MTELIWDGKYDSDGRKVSPPRLVLPFQTVETVNESAQERQHMLDLFTAGRNADWRNRLIWGDKKYVLPSLLDEFGGRVNLVYIDPPFNVGADFSFGASIPSAPEVEGVEPGEFVKEPNIIEQKAYRDTWGRDLDSYAQWFHDMVLFLRELLAEDGCLYVHLDWHVGSYAKVILDEVFGRANCQNEIIWKRTSARSDSRTFNHIHDIIFLYTKSDTFTFNAQYTPYDKGYVERFYRYVEAGSNRRFMPDNLTADGTRKGSSGDTWRGVNVRAKGLHWKYTIETLEELDRKGRIYMPPKGEVPRYKRYLDEMPGLPLQSVWTDINPVAAQAAENAGYATQKPTLLLERLLTASTRENDLVLDCVCGSGTTAAVAERLNRRWIVCDLSRFAIHTTRKRLLSLPGVRPFAVQNLGKYERQAWQAAEFGGASEPERKRTAAAHRGYLDFILGLFRAKSVSGYTWLHGVKGGRMVHVGVVDAPISIGDVSQILAEFKKAVGTAKAGERGELTKQGPSVNGLDILGWDFAFELNEVAKQQAAQTKVQLRFYRIPRDVMDKRAVEQGDVHFFELAALSVDAKLDKRSLTLALTDFVIPVDDVPEDVQKAIRHWSQWIDYWAVDWDFKGDTFHNEWQAYRTHNDPELLKQGQHTYETAGAYTVVVKVIDILGNDTTKAITVKVK